jgi:hypothetical protein
MEVQTHGQQGVQDSDLVQGVCVRQDGAGKRRRSAFASVSLSLARVWYGWHTHEVAINLDPADRGIWSIVGRAAIYRGLVDAAS